MLVTYSSHHLPQPRQILLLREVFDFIEEKMDLDKTNTVYIGDNFEKDIIGAKQAGCFFKNR